MSPNTEPLRRLDRALADVILIPIQMVKTKLNLQIRSYARGCLVFTVYEQIHNCLFLKPLGLSECKKQRHNVVCSAQVLLVDKT